MPAYGTDNQGIVVWLKADVRNLLFRTVNTGSRPQKVPYSMGIRVSFSGGQGTTHLYIVMKLRVTNAWNHITAPTPHAPNAFIWRTISHLLTLWCRIFTSRGEYDTKKQIPCLYGIQSIIVLSTKSREWILSWASQSSTQNHITVFKINPIQCYLRL